jgi:glycosyltransferase involved in cell wall biosynthesis
MRVMVAIDVRWYNACADFALTQALSLERIGHDVLVLADPGSPPARMALEYGLDLDDRVNFSSVNIIDSIYRLKSINREYRPDVAIAHRGESHLLTALAARKFGIPVVRFRGDVRRPRADIFSKYLNEKMTDAIAVSTELLKRDYMAMYRLNGIPVEVIYPGIDLSRFPVERSRQDLRRKFNIDPDEIAVGIVGRLSPVKGHKYFLEAVSRLVSEIPKLKVIVAGEDAQIKKENILHSAQRLGIENIIVLGRVQKVEELMAAFDIGVVASIGSEMICRVLLEYYASGIAVVGTAVNQAEEIMNISGAGITVPPRDPISMANAIRQFADDNTLRISHGKNARRWIELNGSIEMLGRNTERFLKRTLDG